MADNDDLIVDEGGDITGGWSEDIPDDISLFAGEEVKEDPPKEKPPAEPPKEEKPAEEPADDPPTEEKKEEQPEPPKEEEETPKPPDSLAKMMADIEERDRKVGERERALRGAEQWKQQAEEYKSFMEDLRRDPIAAMNRAGADVMRVMEQKLGLGEEKSTEEKILERLERIEKAREQDAKTAEQRANDEKMAAAQHNVRQRHRSLIEEAAKIPEDTRPLPHLVAFRSQGEATMWSRAERYAISTGRWLPDEEAARQAEEGLKAEVEMVLDIASRMPQYQNRFRKDGEGQQAAPTETRRTPPGKTTSNKDIATPPPAAKRNDSLIGASDDEVLAAGLAAYAAVARK